MRFKKFLEDYLEEDAVMDISSIGLFDSENDDMLALYNPQIAQEGLKDYDGEKITSSIFGVLTYRDSKDIRKAIEVHKVSATKGYGPILYLLAMQKAKQRKRGLIPYHTPDLVSVEAKNVWKNFFEGKGKELVIKRKVEKDLHQEEYLNYMYSNKENKDLSSSLNLTTQLLKDDPYKEKKDLLVEAFAGYVENAMRKLYPN